MAYIYTPTGLRWDPNVEEGAPGTVAAPTPTVPRQDELGRPLGAAGAAFSSSGYNPSIAPVLGQYGTPEYNATQPPGATPAGALPPPAPVRPPTAPPTTRGPVDPYGLYQPTDELGNYSDMGGIPGIDLPSPEPISPFIDQGVRDQYTGLMNTIAGQAGDQYNYAIPNADPATLDTGLVPQPNAGQIGSTPELERMLSGQGYNPAMLAQLHSRASEDVSRAGLTEMSQAKRALGQAGLNYSPAGAAVQQDVARRNAADQSSASRDIDIANAGVGMENFRAGVGYQQSNASQNMQAANAMALANANRLYSALSQNLANQQQMQMGKFGAETERLGNQASTKAGILGQQGGMLQGASLDQAANSQQMNNANVNNWQLNQAQLDRQRAMENARMREGRWNASLGTLPGFTPNPAAYPTPGAQISPIGAAVTQFGASQTNRSLGNQQR